MFCLGVKFYVNLITPIVISTFTFLGSKDFIIKLMSLIFYILGANV